MTIEQRNAELIRVLKKLLSYEVIQPRLYFIDTPKGQTLQTAERLILEAGEAAP